MGTNYYVRTPGCEKACEHCSQSQLVHLGKTSAGWRFLFQADPEWPREEALARWRQRAATGPIEDEYGDLRNLDELLAMADSRRDLRSHMEPQPDLGMYRRDEEYFQSGGHEFSPRQFT